MATRKPAKKPAPAPKKTTKPAAAPKKVAAAPARKKAPPVKAKPKKPARRARPTPTAPVEPAQLGLTDLQQRFVDEYLVDLNGTQAAIRAGYSPDTARQMASENLSKPYIQIAIVDARKRQQARTHIDADRVVLEAWNIVFADPYIQGQGPALVAPEAQEEAAAAPPVRENTSPTFPARGGGGQRHGWHRNGAHHRQRAGVSAPYQRAPEKESSSFWVSSCTGKSLNSTSGR